MTRSSARHLTNDDDNSDDHQVEKSNSIDLLYIGSTCVHNEMQIKVSEELHVINCSLCPFGR